MILLLVVLNVIVGIYIHRLNRPNDGSEMLFFMSAVVNIFYIFLPFNFQYYKEDIIYFKYFVKVHNKIVKKTENDTFWDKFSTLLESLNINEIDYNNKDLSVPLVIFRIKSDNNLWGISIPDYIIKHPLLPEFKRRAKEIEVEEIIQRIGINIYEDGREK